jgi:hypothetical protein
LKKIDLGQTITIFANIGVIAGIVFLGYELRQNNELMSADANLRLLDNRILYFQRLAVDDGGLAAALLKRAGDEQLTPLESFKLQNMHVATWIMWEWEFGRYLDGYITLDELPVAGWAVNLRQNVGLTDVWMNQRDYIDPSPEFIDFIDEKVIAR